MTKNFFLPASVEKFLIEIKKPARYIGHEFNCIHKETDQVLINIALCFPDVYEIGMSHLGIKNLYNILNKLGDVCCQRCFAPWSDMEHLLRRERIPLFSLETKLALDQFDVLGFSLQSQLCYTNVLNMLELSNIPLHSNQRNRHPLVIAGGPCCYNPEPMAEFIDAFFIGEAEDLILEFIEAYRSFKKDINCPSFAGVDEFIERKTELLSELAEIEGIYVPRFYEHKQEGKGGSCLYPVSDKFPQVVNRRFVSSLDDMDFFIKSPVPYIDVVHDRITVEIMRGCPNRCFFCQAGFTGNPVRLRSVDKVIDIAKRRYKQTGYDTISFCALSSASYPYLKDLIHGIHNFCSEKGLSISLSSLRVDGEFSGIISLIGSLKKSGLTFAPEAGSERLRMMINKNIDIEKLKMAILEAYRIGWRRLKLYFMIGLPTEEEEDLTAIINLVKEISFLRKSVDGKYGKISVSISNFIPKPHTPFQWLGMDSIEKLSAKQEFLRLRLRASNLDVDFHDMHMSFIEAFLSRGQRSTAVVIEKAFELGARFDAWGNMFDFNIWKQAFKQCGINAEDYVCNRRDINISLPWDHISCGIKKDILIMALGRCNLK